MKAYQVDSSDPWETGTCIVWAKNRNKAKMVGLKALCNDNYEYLELRAVRLPQYDDLFVVETLIENNEDLPDGAELFFSADEL